MGKGGHPPSSIFPFFQRPREEWLAPPLLLTYSPRDFRHIVFTSNRLRREWNSNETILIENLCYETGKAHSTDESVNLQKRDKIFGVNFNLMSPLLRALKSAIYKNIQLDIWLFATLEQTLHENMFAMKSDRGKALGATVHLLLKLFFRASKKWSTRSSSLIRPIIPTSSHERAWTIDARWQHKRSLRKVTSSTKAF